MEGWGNVSETEGKEHVLHRRGRGRLWSGEMAAPDGPDTRTVEVERVGSVRLMLTNPVDLIVIAQIPLSL
jgi:hypothetical protein